MSLGKDSSLQPLSPSHGRAEKLAQADLEHGIDLRCSFLKATPWKKKEERGTKEGMEEVRENGNPIPRDGRDKCIGGGA